MPVDPSCSEMCLEEIITLPRVFYLFFFFNLKNTVHKTNQTKPIILFSISCLWLLKRESVLPIRGV